jgi:hypothetical protein
MLQKYWEFKELIWTLRTKLAFPHVLTKFFKLSQDCSSEFYESSTYVNRLLRKAMIDNSSTSNKAYETMFQNGNVWVLDLLPFFCSVIICVTNEANATEHDIVLRLQSGLAFKQATTEKSQRWHLLRDETENTLPSFCKDVTL